MLLYLRRSLRPNLGKLSQIQCILCRLIRSKAPAAWIYCSEVFPLKYRAKGVGLSAATNWIFNFALAFFVAPAFTNIQWKTYIIFGVFCAVMTFHVFFMYPETVRRTLEEIDFVFDTDVPAWRTNKVKARFEEEVENIRRRESTVAGSVGVEEEKEEGEVTRHEEV